MLQSHSNSIYYSKDNLLSRQCVFNYCLGGRGIGKTYAFKKWCVSDYIKNKKEFVWVRRYKEELSPDKVKDFLTDMLDCFPDRKFEITGKKLMIDGKVAGRFIVLSNANFFKSVPMPNVNKVIFDEVILEKGVTKYLPGEMFQLLNLISTITRYRPETIPITDDVRVFCLANRVSIVNPHFDFWGVTVPLDPGIYVKNGVAVEVCDSEAYKQKYATTRHGKLLQNTSFYDYAVNNNPYMDQSRFIKKVPLKGCKFLFTIVHNGFKVGVWQTKDCSIYFSASNQDTKKVFSLDADDHQPNTLLLKSFKKLDAIKQIIMAYSVGLISYESPKVMHIMNYLFSLLC